MPGRSVAATRNRVVVTGASAGAGRAMAQRFGRAGWRVALLARDPERLQAVRDEVVAAGGEALVLPVDVADEKAVFSARDQVMHAWGGIDVWVNSAMATVVSPVGDMQPDEYRRVMDVTFLGCVNGTLAALEAMRPRNAGVIVQVGSALAYRAIPLQSAYCAAKFALRGFTDSLRTELRHERSRIRVSMVQLPGMNTPQFDWARNRFLMKYRPVGVVYRPEVAAEAVYRAATSSHAELWVGGSAIQAIVGQLFIPRILDRMLARKAWDGQMDTIPERRGRADNLERTVHGAYGVDGRFGEEAKDKAWILDPGTARTVLASAAVCVGAALMARLRKGHRQRRLRDA